MSGNQRLNIADFFRDRDDYVILKMSSIFPNYNVPSDVDILCRDCTTFGTHVVDNIWGFGTHTHPSKNGHLQVDAHSDGGLHFKFDLIDSLKEYGLDARRVFKHRRKTMRRGELFWVPDYSDELEIRRIEYKKNPSKTWHLEYILKHGTQGLLSDLGTRDTV